MRKGKGDTGVMDKGEGGRLAGADPTGDKHNSSKSSGVSIISIGNENVVSSVLVVVVTGDEVTPCRCRTALEDADGAAVDVVAILVIGLDSRRPRTRFTCGLLIGAVIAGTSRFEEEEWA